MSTSGAVSGRSSPTAATSTDWGTRTKDEITATVGLAEADGRASTQLRSAASGEAEAFGRAISAST